MAFHASLRNVIGGSTGPGILVGKNEVVVVAIVTGSGDNETPLEQALSVNALRIII
jgi:hypothetical protein